MTDYENEIPLMVEEIGIVLDKYGFEIKSSFIHGEGKLSPEYRGFIEIQEKKNDGTGTEYR